jgi:V/A-type H+-transporting ATPase subunit E
MAQTIDSFISRLRAEGVEAAKKEAEEIRRQAQQEADEIVRNAKAEAQRILQEAERQRSITLERTRTDLELAARDVLGHLRVTLNRALTAILEEAAAAAFADPEFLKNLILQVVKEYAAAEVRGQAPLSIRVPEGMEAQLREWILTQCRQLGGESGGAQFVPSVAGVLSKAGFEYKISSGTVEVTPESVVNLLGEILTPELQAIMERAIKAQGGSEAEAKPAKA